MAAGADFQLELTKLREDAKLELEATRRVIQQEQMKVMAMQEDVRAAGSLGVQTVAKFHPRVMLDLVCLLCIALHLVGFGLRRSRVCRLRCLTAGGRARNRILSP